MPGRLLQRGMRALPWLLAALLLAALLPPVQAAEAKLSVSVSGLTAYADASASCAQNDCLWWTWDFGDGTGAREQLPLATSHTYLEEGTYTITFSVQGYYDEFVSTASQTVTVPPPPPPPREEAPEETPSSEEPAEDVPVSNGVPVGPPNTPPVAAFEAATDGLRVEVDGSNSSDAEGALRNWVWHWGDGTPTGSGVHARHTYRRAGAYVIELYVEDGGGIVQTARREVHVENNAPLARFDADVDGLRVRVDAANATDPDGLPLAYRWSWGDGANATGANATHAFVTAGTYLVTLDVEDSSGARDNLTIPVQVPQGPPRASLLLAPDNLTVTADAAGSLVSGAARYTWDWGDGLQSTGVEATHAYDGPGIYTVTLHVATAEGEDSATAQLELLSRNRPPLPAFTVIPAGLHVGFDATTSTDADGELRALRWDFGDGAILDCTPEACGPAPADTYVTTPFLVLHKYRRAGDFRATLRVVDDEGAANHAHVAVQPERTGLLPFRIRAEGLRVTVDAPADAYPNASFTWDFGGTGTEQGAHARYLFPVAGTWTVRLTVHDDEGEWSASRTLRLGEGDFRDAIDQAPYGPQPRVVLPPDLALRIPDAPWPLLALGVALLALAQARKGSERYK